MKTILDNDIDELGLEIPFSVEHSIFGEVQEVELIPDGKNLLVNDNNKVSSICTCLLYTSPSPRDS